MVGSPAGITDKETDILVVGPAEKNHLFNNFYVATPENTVCNLYGILNLFAESVNIKQFIGFHRAPDKNGGVELWEVFNYIVKFGRNRFVHNYSERAFIVVFGKQNNRTSEVIITH